MQDQKYIVMYFWQDATKPSPIFFWNSYITINKCVEYIFLCIQTVFLPQYFSFSEWVRLSPNPRSLKREKRAWCATLSEKMRDSLLHIFSCKSNEFQRPEERVFFQCTTFLPSCPFQWFLSLLLLPPYYHLSCSFIPSLLPCLSKALLNFRNWRYRK